MKHRYTQYNFWTVEKALFNAIGKDRDAIFFIITIIDADYIFNRDKEDWFYQTQETIENITGLTRKLQEKCIKKLIELNIISKKNMGSPYRRYFKINYKEIDNLINKSILNKDQSISLNENSNMSPEYKLNMSPEYNNKYITNKNINKEKNNNKKESQIIEDGFLNSNEIVNEFLNNDIDTKEENKTNNLDYDLVSQLSKVYKVNFLKVEKFLLNNDIDTVMQWIDIKNKTIKNPAYISSVIKKGGKVYLNDQEKQALLTSKYQEFYNEYNSKNNRDYLYSFALKYHNALIDKKLELKNIQDIYLYPKDKNKANLQHQLLKKVIYYKNDNIVINKLINCIGNNAFKILDRISEELR